MDRSIGDFEKILHAMLDPIRDVSSSSMLDCTSLGAGGPVRLCAEEGHVVAGHFRGGRARVRNRGRKDPVRSASSLAAAARRPGPARRSRTTHAETTPAATPTLTSLTIPKSPMSRRRLAGTSREPTAAVEGPAHAPLVQGSSGGGSDGHLAAGGLRAAGANEPLSRGSGAGAGRHAAPASAAGPLFRLRRTSDGAGVGRAPVDRPEHQPETKPVAAGREAPIRGPVPLRTPCAEWSIRQAVIDHRTGRPPSHHRALPSRNGGGREPRNRRLQDARRRARRARRRGPPSGSSAGRCSGPARSSSAPAWVGWRTYQAYAHLQTASHGRHRTAGQLTDITNVGSRSDRATVGDLQARRPGARSAVDDPIYRAATGVPFVGPNLDAIREVTVTVDSLATDVMPSLVEIAQTLQPSAAGTQGRGHRSGADRTDLAAAAVRRRRRERGHRRPRRDRPVAAGAADRRRRRDPVGQTRCGGRRHRAGARTARLLPPMLGSDGPRTYLVVFQNPAELRATGGIFGSYALVTGRQRQDHHCSIRAPRPGPWATSSHRSPNCTPNELSLYGDEMAQFPQDVNFTPDFPTAAELFAEMYRVRTAAHGRRGVGASTRSRCRTC